MPAQKGIRLDDQERFFPIPETASEEQEPEAIAAIETRTFDLALKNQELMTQQGIFGEELCVAEGQIGKRSAPEGCLNRRGAAAEQLISKGKEKGLCYLFVARTDGSTLVVLALTGRLVSSPAIINDSACRANAAADSLRSP